MSTGTLLSRFRRRAAEEPGSPLYTFVDDAGRDREALSVGDTARHAEAVAGYLVHECGLSPGDRVLLVYPPSLDFVKAFVGCLFAGLVPVPLPPPDPFRLSADLERFAALAESSGARAVLTNTKYSMARTLGKVRNVLARPWRRWPDLPWYTTDRCKPGAFAAPPQRSPSPGDTAFLQYTSGSTSQPKGVMITFGNLEHQLAVTARELGLGPRSQMMAWVPHFHDFGLISGILSALHGNGRFVMMSPLTFIQRPQTWFEVMTRIGATHTAAPNFAYELAVRKTTARERAAWDLSSLEVAMCAAEPIHAGTVRRFVEAFAVAKLRPDAFCPAYGLAEHTVGISTRGRGALRVDREALTREGRMTPASEGADAKVLIACGAPSEGVTVRIVDPASGAAVADGHVGEIWVDSPSKAAGYHGLPDESARTFRARLEGDPNEYLRTGDLGLLHAGQIYVTGRLKDVIILRGKNLYPQDLEDTVRDGHASIRPGGIAAFSIDEADRDGVVEERLVLVVEVRDAKLAPAAAREVTQTIRRLVLEEHQQTCRAVVLVAPGAVPKTTSGKVMRRACREAYSSGDLGRSALSIDLAAVDPSPRPAPIEVPAEPAIDPRRRDLDSDYARLIEEIGATFQRLTVARKGRVFHRASTTLRGELRVLDEPAIPGHRFFAPGRRYAVIVRHSNGVQDDDAGCDNRGATVRVFPEGSDDLGAPLLDLLMTAGACFVAGSAAEFQRWMMSDAAAREAIVRREPHLGAAAWAMFRNPSSYAELHYHTKIASHFRAADGGRWFVRYRLVPADRRDDTGFVDPGGRLVPPEIIPRRAGDARSRTFLHDELRARLATAPITYLLQIQLRAVTASVAEDDAALDCTRPWAEAWRDVATLTLDARADEARVDALRFDPFNAPPDLALPLARSASERASLGHLRSIVYEMAARSRAERAPEPAPASSATAKPERGGRLRVCVVGAGASGLSAAWALEREGHHVTVLERGASVAGKCDSLEIDGRSYDWGGHVCTAQYTSLAAMVDALGVEKEPATPTQVLDLETGRVRPREDSPRLREELLRYHRARDAGFVDVVRPGLHRVAGALAQPVGAWLRAEGLRDLGATLGINYTSCGYGFLGDEELAALYFVKAVEMVGILPAAKPSRLPEMWSVRGGFGAFWCRVAAGLADVRCNVAPLAIERGDDGVVVHTEGGRLEFDRLILASPLDQTPSFLDSTAGERDLFSRIRYLDYHTFVCRAHGLPESGFYLLQQHCEDPRRAGHAVAFHHRHEGSDVYLFYAYGGPDLDRSAIEARLHEDVARLGGRLDAVLDHRPWKYFPHASSRDIEAGYYDRLEALQGQRRTYYVGSLFNFELIECNVAYAHDLVARFFGDEAPSAALPDAPGLVHAAGALPALAEMASPPARAAVLTDYLQRLFAEELRLPALPPPSSRFLELGLDSIKSVEVFQRLSMDTGGRTLAPVIFFDHPTIAELATYLAGELATSPAREPALPSSSRVERPLPTGARVSTTDAYTQIEDVVFADAHGVALTLDVFVPTCAPSGLAIVDVVSALWGSGREVIVHHKVYGTYDAFCRRGFTVFAVRPGSASRFTGEDMVAHVREAIRWVKSRAHEYGIDADRLGLLGGSAGGHLACLAALTPTTGDPAAADRRAQVDSRVHALVAHCPTTRYQPLDVGPEYVGLLRQLAFPAGRSEGYTPAEIAARFEALSPIAHVGAGAPPTLIVHARHDRLVPFDASEAFIAALQAAGNHAELEVRESDRHPWPGIEKDMISAAEWMESTLRPRPLAGGAWLRALRPVADPSLRLVCVHHAGGSAAAFDAWPAGLPEGIEILAVELPGRGAREGEPCSTRLDDVLAALDEALTPLFDRPYALFGHSFGAVIAFELCRRLRRRGAPLPIQLFASGFVGPSVYDHRTALDAVALAPVLELASPVLEADYHLFRTWSHVAEAPLDVPITALGGASDPSTPARALDAWRLETSAAFERVTFPGYHFYLLSDPAPLLEQVSRDLARAAAGDDGEARARSFAAAWRARPHALRGAWNAFDLCWLARIAGPDPREPAFPEALAALVPLQGPDGGVGAPSPHPYCNLVTALAFANTLLRWNDDGRHTPAIERALAHALTEHARAQLPLASFATGTPDRFFRFHGFFGRWLIPARECQSLLDHGGRHLTADQRRMALSYAAAKDLGFGDGPLGEADYDRLFDQDSLALHFAEYFPDHAFTSAAARAHARRAAGLPGLTAAVAARYLEITGDPRAHARISAALERPLDGLRPGGRLQELHFALAYLLRGGVELRRHFGAEIAELEASVSADGVGVEPGARLADADATAVVQHVCHALGLATKMPTRGLDRFWNAEKSSYASADGSSTYTVSTTLHVLEAYLSAPDVTRDEQLAVWQRVVTLLDARPWTELHHLSPFYVWEKIVAIVGAGEHRFPEAPTRAPRDALAQILAHQHASGGFHAALAEAPTVEETALGLLALRSALRWQRGLEARSEVEVEAAARRARSFLRRARLHPTPHPDLWVGKLLYTPVNLVEAIVTSSLAEGVTG